jgi:uncharacterized protein YneF (UPF0154 family)
MCFFHRVRRIMRALLITLLIGFFIVRLAVRRYARKELRLPIDSSRW